MRILCLDHVPSSTLGGQEFSMLDECVGLAARGHEVTLGYSFPGDLIPRYEAGNVAAVHLSRFTVDRDRAVRSALECARGVARALRTGPDVVCVNSYHMVSFGAAIARPSRAPLVCHLRLLPPESMCWQWRVGLPHLTRFIAVSYAVRAAYAARGVDPHIIDVVHGGLDLERFRPTGDAGATRDALGVPRDAFVLLFAGRLDRDKNLEALLRAFAALGLGPERARLLVAGRPVQHPSAAAAEAYLRTLHELSASLGVEDSVHWLGSRADLPALYTAADLTALFTGAGEALARTTYESMACGTPAIAWEAGGMTEVLSGEFRRFAFDGSRPSEVNTLIRSLMHWRRDDPGLGARAREHVRTHFALDAMVEGIERSLDMSLRDRPRRRGPRPHLFATPPTS